MRIVLRNHKPVPKGGQPNNQNAAKGVATKDSFLGLRCRGKDKAAWVRASKRAQRENKVPRTSRGLLADWAIMVLNEAADKQNGPQEAAARVRGLEPASAAG